jgi:hypothetical protein
METKLQKNNLNHLRSNIMTCVQLQHFAFLIKDAIIPMLFITVALIGQKQN